MFSSLPAAGDFATSWALPLPACSPAAGDLVSDHVEVTLGASESESSAAVPVHSSSLCLRSALVAGRRPVRCPAIRLYPAVAAPPCPF